MSDLVGEGPEMIVQKKVKPKYVYVCIQTRCSSAFVSGSYTVPKHGWVQARGGPTPQTISVGNKAGHRAVFDPPWDKQ